MDEKGNGKPQKLTISTLFSIHFLAKQEQSWPLTVSVDWGDDFTFTNNDQATTLKM